MAAAPNQVASIIGLDVSGCDLVPYIEAANCVLAQVSGCTAGMDQDCLDQACAWLAAHLFSITPNGQKALLKKSEDFEEYSVEYVVKEYEGQGILATPYGSTANALVSGCLGEVDKRQAQVCFFGGV